MPIRRRDHGFARAERISQCSRRNLGFVQIRGNVKIRRSNELGQFLQLHKTVVEDHVALELVLLDDGLQAKPVGVAPRAQLVGVRGAQHDVDDLGKLRHDIRECVEHMFNSLVRRQQPEGQQHLLSAHAKLFLVTVRGGEWHVGDTMRDQIDLGRRRLVHLLQEVSSPLRHDHQPG